MSYGIVGAVRPRRPALALAQPCWLTGNRGRAARDAVSRRGPLRSSSLRDAREAPARTAEAYGGREGVSRNAPTAAALKGLMRRRQERRAAGDGRPLRQYLGFVTERAVLRAHCSGLRAHGSLLDETEIG